MDYHAAIIEAASEYRAARTGNAMERSEETMRAESKAYDKLCWMLDAKRFGWNPTEYQPED